MLRKVMVYAFIGMVVLILGMGFTTPSKATFNNWVHGHYNIKCEEGYCLKEDKKIKLTASHLKNAFVFSSYEQQFQSSNGKETTIRTVGVFGKVFEMENNQLWETLN
ncbi:hypothetical protein [Pseudalkalibacillus sp. NRS-1564]|uniref:hypothetical protein n=1 Tax=Pseudalkalibacillus sp. NRS-1564 TaxID=3233900 RepID=UPI003D2A9433